MALRYASIGPFLPFPGGREEKNKLVTGSETDALFATVRLSVCLSFRNPGCLCPGGVNDGRCHKRATETARAAAPSAADRQSGKRRGH